MADDEDVIFTKKKDHIESTFSELIRNEIRIALKEIDHSDCGSIDSMNIEVEEPSCKKCSVHDIKKLSFGIKSTFIVMSLIWVLLCLAFGLCKNEAAFILLIPILIFTIGYMNSIEICNTSVTEDVFGISFISMGILFSAPLISMINSKYEVGGKDGKVTVPDQESLEFSNFINKIIFLAMICVLFSYIHLWVNYRHRIICKIIRSCLETFSVSLYIYAMVLFFMRPQ